jgi:multiple sugar transport system permease protein
LVHSFSAMSLCLIFISPFLLRLHSTYFDQVQIDGASSYVYLRRILLPQLRGPVLFAFTAAFMLSWSDFLFAGVFVVSEHTRTLPVLISSFLTSYGTAWGPMYAAICTALSGAVILIGSFLLGRVVLSYTPSGFRRE